MTTEILTDIQALTEVRTHYVDFTNDLPSGVTISSVDGEHLPPSGNAGTPTFGTVTNNIVPMTIGPMSVTGRHVVRIEATLSDAEIITARLVIPVEWDIARSGMHEIIQDLRLLANAASDDFYSGGIPMFTDKRIQDILDQHRSDHYRVAIAPVEMRSGGSVIWKDYPIPFEHIEQTTGGTSIFYIEDASGNAIGTANYSVDYRRGWVYFNNDTGGSVLYFYGRSYDLQRAAGEIWRHKASYYGNKANFSTDNMRVEAGRLYENALRMAESFEGRASTSHIVTLYRSDNYAE